MTAFGKPLAVVEGPDGAGKTTLVQAIAERFGVPTFHHRGPQEVPQHRPDLWYRRKLWEHEQTGGAIDRLAMTEYCYGLVMRNHTRITFNQLRQFEGDLTDLQGKHILCLPSLEVCARTWQARAGEGKEMFTDPTAFKALWAQYERMARSLNVITYDFTREPLDTFVARLFR